MKKFLLSLAVLFAGVATAQTYYYAWDAVTEFEENYPYLLSCDDYGSRFLNDDGENYLTSSSDLPTDAALIEFESAGTLEEDGETVSLYYIKFTESGLYIADQEILDGFDSSDMLDYKKPYIQTTDDVAFAAKWSVKPAETRNREQYGADGYMTNWRVWTGQGDGTGETAVPFENSMVIMRDKVTTTIFGQVEGDHDPVYLEVQGDYTLCASWNANSWFIFEPEEMNEDDLLYHWVDTNFPENFDALLAEGVGNRPGMYSPESAEALEAAFEAFIAYDTYGEGDPTEILNALIAGKEALKVNEVEEGYYYLTSKRGSYVAYESNGGIIGNSGFVIPTEEGTDIPSVTVETSTYLWHFAPVAGKERTFLIKNFGSGKYASTSAYDTPLVTSEEGAEYTFDFLEGRYGIVYIYHKNDAGQEDCAWNIFSNRLGTPVGHWRDRNDEGNFWYLTPVAAEKVEAIKDEVVQNELNQRLQGVYENALAKYNLGRSYKPEVACTADDDFSSHGYLTYEADADGNLLSTNVTVVDANGNPAIHATDGAGSVIGFLDGNKATYTHTVWSGTTYPHNFDIDLGEGKSLEAIALKMMRRKSGSDHNASFGFGEPKIFVRNDTLGAWKMVGTLPITYNIPLYARDAEGNITTNDAGEKVVEEENFIGLGACGLGGAYRYIRVQHFKTLPWTVQGVQENTYFSASEFALFGAAYDEATSLNTVVPAEVISALLAQMDAAKAQLAASKATETQITALQKALDEFIKNFPEPSRLVDAVAAAEEIAGNLPMGGDDEVGYYPETAVLAYAEIVDAVKASIKEVMTLDEINNGIAQLDAAKEAVLKTLVMPASGFYQVKMAGGWYEEALMHSSCVAADTKEARGLRVEFAKQKGNVDDGLFDDENYINKVSSVWYFEVGENNKVAIRSLANGLYLKPVLSNFNYAQMTEEKFWFEVQADGLVNGGFFNIILGNDTTTATKGRPLYANNHSSSDWTNGYLIAWESANGLDNSSFKFEEVDLADFGYGQNTFVLGNNKTQFFTLPYDAVMYGQSAKVCEVVGYYEDPETEEKAVYFRNIQDNGAVIEGGKAYLVQTDGEVDDLTVELEGDGVTGFESFNYTYTAKEVNGLKATIFSEEVDPGYGVFNIANRIVATTNTESNGEEVKTTIAPMSGYIVPSNVPRLNAAPEGEEFVKIMSLVDFDYKQPEPEPEPDYTCTLIDGVVYSTAFNKQCTQINYTRTLPNLYWNALYIPFEVPYESISDKYNVAYINAIRSYDHDDDGALDELEMEVVKIKAGTLKANYPYLIQAKTEADRNVSISVSDATLYAAKENSIDCSTVYQKYEVTGTYNVKTAAQLAGKLAISIDGAWQPLLAGSQLNPYRLYLSITNRNDSPVKVSPEALSRVRIVEKGQYTGIDSVDGTPAENVIYDLSGRRVKHPAKGGVYIQNGKKVIL